MHDTTMRSKGVMNKVSKLLAIFVITLLLIPLASVNVFAEEGDAQQRVVDQHDIDNMQIQKKEGEMPKVVLPDVQTGDILTKIETKGADVVSILQTFGGPFLTVVFIIGVFMAIIGLAGRNGGVKGFMVMLFAAVSYGIIMAAPEIIMWFSSWVTD